MDSWPMIRRCKEAQWRGLPPEIQDYLFQEAERGLPTFMSLGHMQHNLWTVERYTVYSPYPLPTRNADHLICIKIDHWPEGFEGTKV